MANEEVLGPRKTMFVLVIVVGCFAVLWPRILSPLLMGPSREQMKPNQFDREAGCCEVIFEKDMAILELINEVCNSYTHTDKLSPYSAAECRKAVNETCGLDIAAFMKRSDNVGKTSRMLAETMKNSNSSCLREHFGVPVYSLGPHVIQNSWTQQDTMKQERPIRGAGPHPALRERGRAIPAGAPAPPTRGPVPMPPHARVRSSPLSVYFELDIKPPPIPGMRPPLGSPGGPVPAPKSSMGLVMPLYTLCIIVFFVYTLSRILFKRTGAPYEPITPDPQFRRRVFRDDSRTSPDKLGDVELEALRARLAETERAMQRIVSQLAQRDGDVQQDNNTRPYTNGTIIHNSGPVHIVASEYQEPAKEKTEKETTETVDKEQKESNIEDKKESEEEPVKQAEKEASPEPVKESTPEPKEPTPERKQVTEEKEEEEIEEVEEVKESSEEPEIIGTEELKTDLKEKNGDIRKTEDFLREEIERVVEEKKEKQSTPELLEEAIKDEEEEEEEVEEEEEQDEQEKEQSSVKVVGMEVTAHLADGGSVTSRRAPPAPPAPAPRAHEAESVKSIFLETDIPQQSRVLVTEFAQDRTDKPAPTKHSPMVVSGKMTLSLIQDAPRDTPERDQESTVDDFTTASAVTQNAAEKQGEESDEEIEEEIEIEEIEEEVEEVEEEEEEEQKQKEPTKKTH
ncbi:RIC3 acetylcholine receptor chaperone isoform X3 [Anticarsia gemmatalis]|uniref:RIC3 acetylcholine receptor chaperone isoform X3 n=1 Tax=Anticarsia gemmatalis TaxID=129554 RepID=UPI003F76F0FE